MMKGELSLATGKKKVLPNLILQLLLMKLSSSQRVLFQKILQEVQSGHTKYLSSGWNIVIRQNLFT